MFSYFFIYNYLIILILFIFNINFEINMYYFLKNVLKNMKGILKNQINIIIKCWTIKLLFFFLIFSYVDEFFIY